MQARHVLPVLTAVAVCLGGAAATCSAARSPSADVAQAKREWLADLRASAKSGDRDAIFPSPSRATLVRRLARLGKRYDFDVVSVTMLHPLQGAPVIVIRSDAELPIAHAVPQIVEGFDPRHVTAKNPSGYAYEGYFLVAVDGHGVPYLATFNHWRAPHVGGGEFAAREELYPFAHG